MLMASAVRNCGAFFELSYAFYVFFLEKTDILFKLVTHHIVIIKLEF